MDMIVKQSEIAGVFEIKFDVFEEIRGNIWTTYSAESFKQCEPFNQISFNHDKFSVSNFNVFRGFHGDQKSTKLVTCVYGEVMQYVLDWRNGSPSYGQVQPFSMTRSNKLAVLVPPGCGNAFHVLSEQAVYHTKLSYEGQYSDAENQFTVHWHDSEIKNFPVENFNPILSERDS